MIITLLHIFFLSAVSFSPAHANDNVQSYTVKAAFVFNFAKFVTWPSQAFDSEQSPLVIGILGRDPFGDSFKVFNGQTVQNRKVVVRHVENASEAPQCHILFISDSGKKNLREIIKSLRWSHVLTVSDMDGFCEEDGMISLIDLKERIGFEVNISAARRAGLKISSQLLKLARKTIE